MRKIDLSRVYSGLLRAHSAVPRRFSGSGKAFPLLNVFLELTHRCNLRCAMCFQPKKADSAGELGTAEIKRMIDGLPAWAIVTLTGGEPFMRKDFREILAYTIKKRRCNILTNAELITDQDIDSFVDNKLALIGISLDGLREAHDAIRNRRGLFDKAADVIKKISKKKKEKGALFPLVDIKTVILKRNLGDLHAIGVLANELGADFFTLSLPKLSNRQFNEPCYEDLDRDIFSHGPLAPEKLEAHELETLQKQLGLVASLPGPVRTRFYPGNMSGREAIEKYYGEKLAPGDFKPCAIPWSFTCVSPYGDVFPCLSYKAGNVREAALKGIWNGPRFSAFRNRLNKKILDQCCLGCCYSVYKT